jgi:uncharacterized membrane protein YbhN (UPF0104 family)
MVRLGVVARSFCDGVKHFVSYRTLLIAFVVAPLPWLWESLVIRLAAQSFDVHLTAAQAFSVLIGLNVGMLVPSPGALGAVEAGGTAALVLCGAGHPAAAAFMVVYHLTQLFPGLCAGVALLVAEHRLLPLRRRSLDERGKRGEGGERGELATATERIERIERSSPGHEVGTEPAGGVRVLATGTGR